MRLIAFDLDGTLLDHDKTVPERSLALIEQLRAHGCRFAVITGRARVPEDVQGGVCPDATATNNGGTVMLGETLVAEHALTPQQVRVLDALIPQEADVIAFGPDAIYSRDPAKAAPEWLAGRALLPLSAAGEAPVLKFNVLFPAAHLYREAVHSLGGLTVTGGVPPYEHFLTVTPQAANKGQALRDIAHALRVPLSRTVAFGDSDNDLAMFQVAGTAVQVGDAACLSGAAHERVSCSALGLPRWLEKLVEELARTLPSA